MVQGCSAYYSPQASEQVTMTAGDYPLSATIATEYSPTKWRGAFVASVFAMQVRL